MNVWKVGACLLLCTAVTAAPEKSAPVKTALARDVFVEYSVTDFELGCKVTTSHGGKVYNFHLSVPEKGSYELLYFLNGNLTERRSLALPGVFRLNTGGLSPRDYRLTIQVVDKVGRIGKHTRTLHLR